MISSAGTHLATWIFQYFHFDFSIFFFAILFQIFSPTVHIELLGGSCPSIESRHP